MDPRCCSYSLPCVSYLMLELLIMRLAGPCGEGAPILKTPYAIDYVSLASFICHVYFWYAAVMRNSRLVISQFQCFII